MRQVLVWWGAWCIHQHTTVHRILRMFTYDMMLMHKAPGINTGSIYETTIWRRGSISYFGTTIGHRLLLRLAAI